MIPAAQALLRAVVCGALLVPATTAEEAPEYYTFLAENICPLAVGDAPADPPLYEGWQEDGQFEASASDYLTANDLLLVNSEDNPSSLHFNGWPGWYSLDASAPAAFTKFSMQCGGNCPAFEIQYSDDINPGYDAAAAGQPQDAADEKTWYLALQVRNQTLSDQNYRNLSADLLSTGHGLFIAGQASPRGVPDQNSFFTNRVLHPVTACWCYLCSCLHTHESVKTLSRSRSPRRRKPQRRARWKSRGHQSVAIAFGAML